MIQGKIKRAIYFSCCAVASGFNKLWPKNKNKIVFFSTTNLYDNSEALFQYLVDQNYQEKYKIICAVRNPQDYKELEKKNIVFKKVTTSLFHILNTKFLFYHNEMLAVRPSRKQIWVDFWHATTFKKINKMIDPDYKYDYFTYLIATSETYRPIFAEAFGCELDRIIINGHPRNDYLFDDRDELKKLNVDKSSYSKTFLWAPTYRVSFNQVFQDTDCSFIGETGLPIFLMKNELEQLNEFLEKENSLMYIKVHPAQKRKGFLFEDMSNIRYLFNDTIDAAKIKFYSLLKQMDVLITDYSSVFFDFLLLDRPIGFTIEDLNSYSENRGFVFDNPLDYMPGEKITSIPEFYSFINDCILGKDLYKEERKRINKLVNYYTDGKNCKRILDFVGVKKDNGDEKNG